MSTVVMDLAAPLREALSSIEEERELLTRTAEEKRREFDEHVASESAKLEARKAAIERAIEALGGETQMEIERRQDVPLSISGKALRKIRDYLQRNPDSRQADIVKSLDLNSGTVSVGLRVLMSEGLVRRGEKRGGSQVWLYEEKSAVDNGSSAQRETVVRPGETLRTGRLV